MVSANMLVLRLLDNGVLDAEEARKLLIRMKKAASRDDLVLPIDGLKKIELEYEAYEEREG